MRLVINKQRFNAPGDPAGLISGVARQQLTNVKKVCWSERVSIGPNYLAEFDGSSNVIDNAIQRCNGGVITFVDSTRFLRECSSAEVTSVREPGMPSQIHSANGDVYSAIPLVSELGVEEVQLGEALTASGFTYLPGDYFKFPMYKYAARQMRVGDLFGSDAPTFFAYARMISRNGPAENLLQAMQPDSETKVLTSLSSTIPVRFNASPDEVGVVLDALQVGGLSGMASLINQCNALGMLRYARVMNATDDQVGLGVFFYYAMMHPGFLMKIPKDVIFAMANPDQSGICTVGTIGGVAVTPLRIQLPPETLQLVSVLRTIDNTAYASMVRARTIYKMLCVMRLLESRGIEPALSTQFAEADRLKLFNLMI